MKPERKCPVCGILSTDLLKHFREVHSKDMHRWRLRKFCSKTCEITYKNKHGLTGNPKEKAKKSTQTRIERGNLFGGVEKMKIGQKRGNESQLRNGSLFGKNREDITSSLYLIGFFDTKTDNYVVKCGKSLDVRHRIYQYSGMGYKFLRGFIYTDTEKIVSEIESKVNYSGKFEHINMDRRTDAGGHSNGSSEWFKKTEFKKIYYYLTSDLGLTLSEITLN